ncbi:MAG: type II secretion system protein GspN, partial [Proteobacteria bacterium]|nr:type II secretion system protein GspN [Pseudomonadota bacterium]
MQRKLLMGLALTGLGIIVFVVAVILMFPTDALRHFVEETAEKQLKYEQSVRIEDIRITPFLTARMKNFRMMPRYVEPEDGSLTTEGGMYAGFYCAPGVDVSPFIVDEVLLNPSLFSLLRGKPSGSFTVVMREGVLGGNASFSKEQVVIEAKARDIALNEFALLSNMTRAQFFGTLGFETRVVMQNSDISEMSLELVAQNTALCPKRMAVNMGGVPFIELPFTVFGDIKADLAIEDGKLLVRSLTSEGPDIKVDVKGDITLRSRRSSEVRFNLDITILPSQAWLDDNGMGMIYQICRRQDDGSIDLRLRGVSSRLRKDCGTPIAVPGMPAARPAPPARPEAQRPIQAQPASQADLPDTPPPPPSNPPPPQVQRNQDNPPQGNQGNSRRPSSGDFERSSRGAIPNVAGTPIGNDAVNAR